MLANEDESRPVFPPGPPLPRPPSLRLRLPRPRPPRPLPALLPSPSAAVLQLPRAERSAGEDRGADMPALLPSPSAAVLRLPREERSAGEDRGADIGSSLNVHPDQREFERNQYNRFTDREKQLLQQLSEPCISDPNGITADR